MRVDRPVTGNRGRLPVWWSRGREREQLPVPPKLLGHQQSEGVGHDKRPNPFGRTGMRPAAPLARPRTDTGPAKTRASHRTILLPQVVADALAAHLAAFPAESDGLVFTQAGKPITRSTFGYGWRAAVKEAKLPHGTGFHPLRHYYASLLIHHGESLKTVQARLGNASAVETLDTYSHL
jgi:integrase